MASGDMICGCSVMKVGLMHLDSRNSPTSLSSNLAVVRGGEHSMSCFRQRASRAARASSVCREDGSGSLVFRASSKSGNIRSRFHGGVKSMSQT